MDNKNVINDEELEKVVGGTAKGVDAGDIGLTVEQSFMAAKYCLDGLHITDGRTKTLLTQLNRIMKAAMTSMDFLSGVKQIVACIDGSGTANADLLKIADDLRVFCTEG